MKIIKRSELAQVALLVEAVLGLPEGAVVAVPEVLAGVEVVDALALRLLPVYVDVLLLRGRLVEEGRVLLAARHVVPLEDARRPARVVAAAGPEALSALRTLALLLAVHVHELSPQTAVLRGSPQPIVLQIHRFVLLPRVDHHHFGQQFGVRIFLQLLILPLDIR